jgi:serine/threonine protein kinase
MKRTESLVDTGGFALRSINDVDSRPHMAALAAGSRIGQYEVISAIGAGGMGEVYRARDTKLGRDVALKILPDSFAAIRDGRWIAGSRPNSGEQFIFDARDWTRPPERLPAAGT